jgi:N-acetylglucosamine kinase-like BadF-type ATPase
MRRLVAGIDVGGTKTHVRVVPAHQPDLPVNDLVVPSRGWSATPVDSAATWLCRQLTEILGATDTPLNALAAVAVGAQGCEDRAHCQALRNALSERIKAPVIVVNDAELLVRAAGLEYGTAVVVGTGAIAVATDAQGAMVRAGGWGWVLSDDGSASALVRDAARAVLDRADLGKPLDALGELLLASVGVQSIPALALQLSWGDGPEHWGDHARAVVAAAEAGSPDAARILGDGARSVAALVEALAQRGVLVEDAVFGGGLVTNVPAYWSAIRARLSYTVPQCRPVLLGVPPVTGAVALACCAEDSPKQSGE